jgi:hypothetical protein
MLSGTAPEYSTGEVLLASVYRRLILGVNENSIDLENIKRAHESMPDEVGGPALWSSLLMDRGGISSPLRHGQYSPLESRQLMPLVPAVARIAGVLGKRPRSRWNPSNLLLETIGAGASPADGEAIIRTLREALAVTDQDDVFARFIEHALRQGLQNIAPPPGDRPQISLGDDVRRPYRNNSSPARLCPAERFCKDLPTVIGVKPSLTRRQWSVLIEASLRIGLGMHVLWMCKANALAWELVLAVASGAPVPAPDKIESTIWDQQHEASSLLELGSDAEALIERHIEQYAYARTGLNLLLYRLDDNGAGWPQATPIGFSASGTAAPSALANFLAHVAANRQSIDPADAGRWLRVEVGKLFDDTEELHRLARRKAGYTKNLFEFARQRPGPTLLRSCVPPLLRWGTKAIAGSARSRHACHVGARVLLSQSLYTSKSR